MPLEPGSSAAVVSRNISKLVGEGVPRKEAVARALENGRRTGDPAKKKRKRKRRRRGKKG